MTISVLSWIISWTLSALTIALITGIIDEASKRKLEDHQEVGFFLVFVLPTIIEAFSYYSFNQPVFLGLI